MGLASCYPEYVGVTPFPLDERTCNLITDGDCGTFESDADGIVSPSLPWSFTRVDSISFERNWSIRCEKNTGVINDSIIWADDSIMVDSGSIYNLICYVNVERIIQEVFPIIGVGYEPKGNDITFLDNVWVAEEGLDRWFRMRLTFMATSNKPIKVFVYEDDIVSTSVTLFLDKFKLMNVATNNKAKCCGVIED